MFVTTGTTFMYKLIRIAQNTINTMSYELLIMTRCWFLIFDIRVFVHSVHCDRDYNHITEIYHRIFICTIFINYL